jgi:hypothetical protein
MMMISGKSLDLAGTAPFRSKRPELLHRCLCALLYVCQRYCSDVFTSQSSAKARSYWSSHGGHGNVAQYRAYQIGPDGRIKSGVDLDCADDAEAIEAAGQLVGECAVELWQGTRMVARLEVPPTRAP